MKQYVFGIYSSIDKNELVELMEVDKNCANEALSLFVRLDAEFSKPDYSVKLLQVVDKE